MRFFALFDLNIESYPAADAIQLQGYGRTERKMPHSAATWRVG